jgi:putative ABC transport system substrate-binding protein
MRRRAFIALAGAAAAASLLSPHGARAQQDKRVRRVGVLVGDSATADERWLTVLRDALQKLGWTEDRNVKIETRWSVAEPDELNRSAQALIAFRPDVVIALGTPRTAALMQQTGSIPVVFANVSDPVGAGFIASLARPGGNLTGFIDIEAAMGGKWVQLLKDIAPNVARVALPYNPATAPGGGDFFLGPFKAAAAALGVEAIASVVRDASELDAAMAAQANVPNSGLVLMPDAFIYQQRDRIISFAARDRVPAIFASRYYCVRGGLIAYGADPVDNWQRAAAYVDRILRGAKPSELPVQIPVKFELVINLKTAKALGLEVPESLLVRADEVIE